VERGEAELKKRVARTADRERRATGESDGCRRGRRGNEDRRRGHSSAVRRGERKRWLGRPGEERWLKGRWWWEAPGGRPSPGRAALSTHLSDRTK
jgi:hypothetical protein